MHKHVRGAIDRSAGPHPAGTPYAADRPDMLLWILACLADSALVIYRSFVDPLADPAQRERFWSDYLLLGELFGLPRDQAPADYQAFRDYMRERVHSDELFVTDEAREIGRRVALELPLPASRRAALPAINLAVLGTLPPRVRELYRLAVVGGAPSGVPGARGRNTAGPAAASARRPPRPQRPRLRGGGTRRAARRGLTEGIA